MEGFLNLTILNTSPGAARRHPRPLMRMHTCPICSFSKFSFGRCPNTILFTVLLISIAGNLKSKKFTYSDCRSSQSIPDQLMLSKGMYSCIPRSASLSLTFHSWTLHAQRPRRRPRRGSRRFPCHINIRVSQNHIRVFSLAT